MPSFNPQQVANKTKSGNSVLLQIGDQAVMFAQTVGASIATGAEQLYGIGSSKPQEIQQYRMSPSITLDSFELTQNGLNLLQAGNNLNYILAGNQFTITILDGETNAPVYVYVGCKCSNFGASIPTNAPIRDNYSFLAMDVLTATGVSIMDTGDNALELTGAVAATVASGLGVG
jgi:hypothetical protein